MTGNIVKNIIFIVTLVVAVVIGNWFHKEVKKSQAKREKWYKPYISLPGLIVLVAVTLLPLIMWIINR